MFTPTSTPLDNGRQPQGYFAPSRLRWKLNHLVACVASYTAKNDELTAKPMILSPKAALPWLALDSAVSLMACGPCVGSRDCLV